QPNCTEDAMKIVFACISFALLALGLFATQPATAHAPQSISSTPTGTLPGSTRAQAIEVPRELRLDGTGTTDSGIINCGSRFHWCQCPPPNQGCSGCAPRPSPCDGFCRC